MIDQKILGELGAAGFNIGFMSGASARRAAVGKSIVLNIASITNYYDIPR